MAAQALPRMWRSNGITSEFYAKCRFGADGMQRDFWQNIINNVPTLPRVRSRQVSHRAQVAHGGRQQAAEGGPRIAKPGRPHSTRVPGISFMLSLRSSLILIFVLLVTAPLGVFWAWPQSRALQNELDQVSDRHLLIARSVGAALQRYHRDASGAFDFVADSLLTARPQLNPQPMLANLRFHSICLVEREGGRTLRGHKGTGECLDTWPASTLTMLADHAVDGRTVTTPVHAGMTGEPTICWLRRSGQRFAVMGCMDTHDIVQHATSIAFGYRGHAAIVDQTGKVIAHPIASWMAEMRDLSQLAPVAQLRQGRTGIARFHSPALGADVIAGYAAVPGAGWGVMIPQPISELTQAADRLRQSALALFAMSLLLAALVACRAAFTLLNPVRGVIDGASAMARGATEIRLPRPGRLAPTELVSLTSTFNAMAASIEAARKGEAEARLAAEQANRSKTDFLRNVTHELRSPVNAIVGFADLLVAGRLGSRPSPEAEACINDIRSGARLMLSLTNDLLDLARIEAGQYEIADEVVDLLEIAARAARFTRPASEPRQITVSVDIGATFPAVRGDERALFQCVLNLVSNAVKYGRDRGAVRVTASLGPAGDISIAVADDGPGIAPEDIDRIQLPFQRIASPANRGVHGTGLGLPIVKKLVELHGGTFRIESTPGIGTTAVIRLPASRVMQDAQTLLDAAE